MDYKVDRDYLHPSTARGIQPYLDRPKLALRSSMDLCVLHLHGILLYGRPSEPEISQSFYLSLI